MVGLRGRHRSRGQYDITARVASADSGTKTLHVTVDGLDVSGPISFAPTNGWQTWKNVSVTNVQPVAGKHQLRIVFDTGKLNLNYLDVQ